MNWPRDHAIGAYLSVDGEMRLVGTARGRQDVSSLLRHLADEWDRLGNLPAEVHEDNGDYYRLHVM